MARKITTTARSKMTAVAKRPGRRFWQGPVEVLGASWSNREALVETAPELLKKGVSALNIGDTGQPELLYQAILQRSIGPLDTTFGLARVRADDLDIQLGQCASKLRHAVTTFGVRSEIGCRALADDEPQLHDAPARHHRLPEVAPGAAGPGARSAQGSLPPNQSHDGRRPPLTARRSDACRARSSPPNPPPASRGTENQGEADISTLLREDTLTLRLHRERSANPYYAKCGVVPRFG